MSGRAYLFEAVAMALVLVVIVRQVRLRRLRPKWGIIWLVSAVLVAPLAFVPGLLDWFAEQLGVDYPPALLLVFGLGFFAMLTLQITIELTQLQERTRVLAEEAALLRSELDRRPPRGTDDAEDGRRLPGAGSQPESDGASPADPAR